ncbi:tetratricopeptide repeat protein [Salinicoccus albus]|uniref:tetratricopeptide repeat protein n=1 Tax=Salinicoccus albus TaxID=418756 RepID=UPI00036F801F|nr:tetratricopeptide repeat protein [Salinicoccus albus]
MQEQIYSVIDDLKSGKYPEEDLNQLLNSIRQLTDEESMESLFTLGDALVQAGAMEEAETIFMHIYNQMDHDDEVIAYMTDIYIADGKLDDALNLINQAPKTKTVLMSKAEIFQQLNMNDVSIRLINEAKEIEDEPVLDFALAEIYYQDGDFESALRYYRPLIDQNFEDLNGVNLNLRLAELYMNQIELEESRAYFEKVDEKQYSNDDFYRKALVEYQLESYESAKNLLDKVIENEPYYINAYILLMNVHETEHELDAAISTLENYLAEDDTNPLIFFHIGRLNFRSKNSDKAIEAFKKSISLDQDYDDAYLMLFETLLQTERTDEIAELYPNLDTHALSGESLYLLAKIEQENENDDNALKFYQDAEKLIGESLEFYTDYYKYLTEIGHSQKSPVLDKLIQLDPNNIEWQFERERLENEEDQL